ncbi:phospholipid-transporting ATPase IF-like [Eriocheir sinensis]|uniref:phospholipid-transporting ATPase IF-like n=1 Tax=Eriocheir sinensis TaxID=95602 RepID=UPI0021C61395|nr:phospholipid-transporting ATPase IF-like [Eriocheir sinensis]XP_050716967.1 phospholipid-transporting ATPase IF-like [Eriocheir sinensis]XP_050716968.1 phospholipid-transporting ATPase IF-like [Eriocheir sinensis]XP_050716969.1 phospholipid-transporting ATPase IF-like [Eriocheir sinensis]XP_050716970.1 phospholipid-transporting ATPase IF-like [Eriocheir sinensis]XP_050716972.1 phospholipid-transporting ATPase IF-like [Eriocheir sinensis]XP_050716973.1 phospholipid-transporting ATPase IF-li
MSRGVRRGSSRRRGQPITTRTVLVNGRPPENLPEPLKIPKYVNNQIKTSKYTWINFLPKNLFEQFRRIANFYFLLVTIIQLSIESPVSPMTSILPLVFVVSVTAVKQAYEDWLRHREDNKVNNSPATVLRDGEVKEVRNQDIVVGDVVKVEDEEGFPCDLLLLLSSNPEAKCEVTTANLDGETNLKTFVCPGETQHLQTPEDLSDMRAVVECQLPHANLYDFKGRLDVYRGNERPDTTSLATDNLLLRGARLRNTPWVYGLAVYTGKDTKMALNLKMTSAKFSTVEKTMNYFLLFYLVVLVLEITCSTLVRYLVYDDPFLDDMWYLGKNPNATVTARGVVQDTFSFLVIYNYVIPISLYVTLEMQKFLGAMFLEWDDELRGGEGNERCKCNTSDLNEELGQVQYLFTDKTGTLTENTMYFRQCSVDGVKYVSTDGELQLMDEKNSNRILPLSAWPTSLEDFLVTLALCHTVQVTAKGKARSPPLVMDSGDVQMADLSDRYQASSPDEKALVEACAGFGVVFVGQKRDTLELRVRGQTRRYTRLQVLDFDSDRKCMSVVVREEWSGRLWLLTKGAESSVLRRCHVASEDEQRSHDATAAHIDDYAMLGLRTLAVGRRELSDKQYKEFAGQLSLARSDLEEREAAVRKVTDLMEAKLTLLGATGVEDLLQEGVQETLEALRVAGIKVWVLTGDKVETAVNIAYSCGHFKKFMTVLTLTGLQDPEHAAARLQQCTQESEVEGNYGLVVDGASLQLLLDRLKDEFYAVCRRCIAVTCCRMSPKQKAETVRLVKKSKERPVCAAIGDGANDVSMIQEAHVGLGVMGKEGRQAVRCADFAFARFRFLKRVLLVHGHWYYVRVSTLVQYSFYKNVTFITPQLFFAIWNAFSTQSVYDSLALTMYNITFTSLPIIIYGIFDQNLPAHLLMERPHLYKNNAMNAALSPLQFLKWTFFGLFHCSVMYFGLMLACADDTCGLPNGQTPDLFLFGTTLVSICVVVTNFKLMLEARYFTHFFFWSVVITLVGYAALSLLYQGFLIDFFGNYGVYWTYYRMFESCSLMLASILLTIVCLIPDVIEQVIRAYKDVRLEERRLKKKKRAVSLKAFVGFVNEAFDDLEGTRSLWEVTRVSDKPPLPYTAYSTPINTINTTTNGYNTTTTNNHYNNQHSNATEKTSQMEQLTVENLQKLDRRTMPTLAVSPQGMDTITEETSTWSQESFII